MLNCCKVIERENLKILILKRNIGFHEKEFRIKRDLENKQLKNVDVDHKNT